jgi:tetratricopeptide (TPR) repeat protein
MMRASILASALTALVMSVSAASADGIEDNMNCYDQFHGGDMKLAIYYCSRAIQSGELEQGDVVVALLNRGVAYKNTGNLEMAVIDYSSALEIAPDDALLYSNRANAYRELGRTAEGLQDINKALELNPENPSAFYVRGLLFESIGDAASARLDFLRAYDLNPEHKEFRERAEALGAITPAAQQQ